jgi:hypothetical protein
MSTRNDLYKESGLSLSCVFGPQAFGFQPLIIGEQQSQNLSRIRFPTATLVCRSCYSAPRGPAAVAFRSTAGPNHLMTSSHHIITSSSSHQHHHITARQEKAPGLMCDKCEVLTATAALRAFATRAPHLGCCIRLRSVNTPIARTKQLLNNTPKDLYSASAYVSLILDHR